MEAFRLHFYVCTQKKEGDAPSCTRNGSEAVLQKLRDEIAARRLQNEVHVTQCGSLGLCEVGPNLVIYPEGTWYSRVTPDDVPEILTRHLDGAGPLDRLAWRDADEIRKTILDMRAKQQRPLQVAPDPGRRPG
jgi:(2Fe-2S) ferredoxin